MCSICIATIIGMLTTPVIRPICHNSWQTPSRFLSQYLLLISEDLWHSPESNFTASAQFTILYYEVKNYTFELLPHLSRVNDLMNVRLKAVNNVWHSSRHLVPISQPVWRLISFSLISTPHPVLNLFPSVLGPFLDGSPHWSISPCPGPLFVNKWPGLGQCPWMTLVPVTTEASQGGWDQ